MRRTAILAIAMVSVIVAVPRSEEPLKWVRQPALNFDKQNKKWYVTFELNRLTDVEVALLDGKTSEVVRHLAGGVLGDNAPPPLTANSRAQKIAWDGKNDYREPVADPGTCQVRVRAGMGVALEQIVGGDPYTFFSKDARHYDHSRWELHGLEAKPDGNVYVLAHSSILGPPALRQYDQDGNYHHTVFPPPAGKDLDAMKGWGVNVKPDGTYTPKFTNIADPSLTTTFLDTKLSMARLEPTPDPDHLTLWRTGVESNSFDMLTIDTDGTIPSKEKDRLPGPLVKKPPLPIGPVQKDSTKRAFLGPIFTCLTPDGKSFYLSGAYACNTLYGSVKSIDRDGFWREGQVWKVDVATRTARPFFALPPSSVLPKGKERIAALGGADYTALHGVAVDADGHVFVCDRFNKRIVVLDDKGKIIRQIPVAHADAIAVGKRKGVLYLTTRNGFYARPGVVKLLKINDWRKDGKPSQAIEVSKAGYAALHQRSFLAVCDTKKGTNVWVAYTEMPVRIYRDSDAGLEIFKDFYHVEGAQRCTGFDRLHVDQKTGDAYVLDDHEAIWRIDNWEKPRITKVPLQTASIAIDPRHRYVYARTLADGASSFSRGKAARFHLGNGYKPANFGKTGTNRITPTFIYNWCFEGNSDRGMAVAPNGNVAVVGEGKDGLRVFAGDETKAPWQATTVTSLPPRAGGVRFDLAGNLYVAHCDRKPRKALPGFEKDQFTSEMGRIYKYAPTGTMESGNLFPKPSKGPEKVYDVHCGAFQIDCVTRTPRFGLDGYGRLYVPTNIAQRVTVVDNAGNEILHFGAYGNRDSMGGLPGDLVPTKGIPMGCPNSVDATDDYIYVADMANIRLLRIKKRFQAVAVSK